jgi:hypothetical protein
VRVIEQRHDLELVDEGGRVLDSAFGNAFDDPGAIGEDPLLDLIDDAIGSSSHFLLLSSCTFMNSKCSLICSLWLLMKNSFLRR